MGVEIEVSVGFLYELLVGLVEVFGQDYIPIPAHGLHARLLADSRDVSV